MYSSAAPIVVPLHMQSIPTRNYVYVVFDPYTRDGLIIDPVGDPMLIQACLDEHSVHVRGILVTHAHLDHVGLVGEISDRCGCDVWVSRAEAAGVKAAAERVQIIDSERPIAVGALTVRPLVTPGHTAGSTCYQVGENLFTGDTLFIEGCGMCTGGDADAGLMFESLKRLKGEVSSATRIFPGHRYKHPIGETFAYVLGHNIYLQFTAEQKNLFIAFRMRRGQKDLLSFG